MYFQTTFIDMQIKTEMFYCEVDNDRISNCAFYSHPRSRISKTPLMLANHTGIIEDMNSLVYNAKNLTGIYNQKYQAQGQQPKLKEKQQQNNNNTTTLVVVVVIIMIVMIIVVPWQQQLHCTK